MTLNEYFSSGGRGSAKDLAEKLVISSPYLFQIASGLRKASPTRAVQIEKATNGLVTRKDLRPNDFHIIWPELV